MLACTANQPSNFLRVHQNMKSGSIDDKIQVDSSSHIKVSNREPKESLHKQLFVGCFAKGVAFSRDFLGSELHLRVVTDSLDRELLKSFQKGAEEFLNIGRPERFTVTGYDISVWREKSWFGI